ncbi:MAG: class I SAM-dependent methyltransferase [Chthoniobacterales bacterium]
MSAIPVTHFTHCHIDLLSVRAGEPVRVDGWIFHPDSAIARVDLSLQGKPWTSTNFFYERPDVEAAFGSTTGSGPAIARCGFSVTAPWPTGATADEGIIVDLAPFGADGQPLGPWRTYHPRDDRAQEVPESPLHLQERIGGSKDFLNIGIGLAHLIINCVGKYRPAFEKETILDWGCGCGRVIAQLMKMVPPQNLHGCDIDAEAIEWDRLHIRGPQFSRIAPYPPTDYAAQSFDVIYGISVMTHLSEETQFLWLKELQLIARPGAILALSVIGENLRRSNMPASLAAEFAEKGFAAFVPGYSDSLRELSHENYYIETFHSPAYIAAHWAEYFDVLEYLETKHQDIVILGAR